MAALIADELVQRVRLDIELDYDVLADKLVERFAERDRGPALVSAKELSRQFGRSPRWWRDHKNEFGGIRRGDGPRPRIDFNPGYVERVLASRRRVF
jgi:hypothetical protein